MAKPFTCGAQYVLTTPTLCDKASAFYFRLSKPLSPSWISSVPPGAFKGFTTIDACLNHADAIERHLSIEGYGPSRFKE
jgi:hypothetical protein